MIFCILENTLTSTSKLLIALDYDEYIREMTRRSLDWRNLLGRRPMSASDISVQWRRTCWMLLGTMEDSVILSRLSP